jgi:chaperonin GroES
MLTPEPDFFVLDRRKALEIPADQAAIPPDPQSTVEFHPLFDRVLVLEDNEARKIGNLFLPDSSKEEMKSGSVISVGPGVLNVKPGDKIIFGKYAGSDIRLGNILFLVMREPEIFGTVTQ